MYAEQLFMAILHEKVSLSSFVTIACLFVCLFVTSLFSLCLCKHLTLCLAFQLDILIYSRGGGGCSVVFLNVQRYIQIADLSIYPCHRWHP